MPTMATQNVEPGLGYRLTFQGKELVFPNFECGPSEFIMSQDYSAYTARWIHRNQLKRQLSQLWAGVTTRQQSRQSPHTVSLDPDPVSGGANFVDVTLKVKVEMSNLHGTTRLCGAHTRAATICFASRIKAAFEKAQQGLLVELHAGAGESGAGEGVYQNSII
ncbi:hypothetical protein B0H14DRAFT_2639393 [Mycena olivaceomarginata]|nr:hypothetical protein B0H14DRAFT_2639393 [Mycena olivaceomarginata]